MLKLLRILLLTALILTGCAKETEPLYEGLTLNTWVGRINSAETEVKIDALKIIQGVGVHARTTEATVRKVAINDPDPEVAMAAIKALTAMGAPVTEFKDFIEQYDAPLIQYTDLDDRRDMDPDMMDENSIEAQMDQYDEDEAELMSHVSSEDDLEYLTSLESGKLDRDREETNMVPTDAAEFEKWAQSKQSSTIDDVLHLLNSPKVLKEMLSSGDALEKEFALRKLAMLSGEDSQIVDALKKLLSEPDSSVSRVAAEALKNWKKP